MGGACGPPRMCKGPLFTYHTQALNPDDTGPEERKVIKAAISDLVVDLCVLPGCVEGISMGNLTGGRHMADAKALAACPSTHGPGARPKPSRRKSLGSTPSAPGSSAASPPPPKASRGPSSP